MKPREVHDTGSLMAGTIVADRFTVLDTLGAGGSAVVFRAHDRVLDRQVALKLLGESASSQVDQSRFEREIRLTARLVHPAIVPLFDSGWHEGRLYYVMPCITGTTLRELLATGGPLPMISALRLIGDVAEALAYAHATGIVHRDIKPENIFSANDRALVADFGIARAITSDLSPTTLTEAGITIGTVAYMSPEQALGEQELDGRSDLYSLGCVLLEVLNGAPPFQGATAMSVLAQHLNSTPDIAARLPDAPAALVELLQRMLAKAPTDRPPSAAAVIDALRAIARDADVRGTGDAVVSSGRHAAVAPAPARELTESERALAEASRLYSLGIQGGEGTRDVLAMARILAEKVLGIDPRNVHAMGVLADIVLCEGFRGFTDEAKSRDEAREIRMRAAAIDDTVGELQSSIGIMRLYWEDDFHGAEAYLARGAAQAPTYAIAQRHYATWLKMAGRFDEALAHVERAVALTPDAPHALVGLADVLMAMGRVVEAITPLQRALRLVPRYDQAMERLEMACHRAGRFDDAYSSRRTLLGTNRLFDRLSRLSEVYEADGWDAARTEDLRAELAQLLALAATEDPFKDRQTSRQLADRIVITCGELGEWKTAMDWVERAYYVRPGRLIRVLTDLPFDRRGLASDRRYARLLRTAGLEFLL